MNAKVNPGDNFQEYVNGTWLKTQNSIGQIVLRRF